MRNIERKRFNYIGNHGDFSIKTAVKRFLHYSECIYKYLVLPSDKELIKKLENILARYQFDNSDYLCNVVGSGFSENVVISKYIYAEKLEIQYRYIAIPKQYDVYLKHVYGKYSQYPNNEEISRGYNMVALIKKHVFPQFFPFIPV